MLGRAACRIRPDARSANKRGYNRGSHIDALAPARQSRTVPLARTTAAAALAAYGAFLLFCLVRLIAGWFRTVQIRRAAETREAPDALKDAWARCSAAFGLAGVELLVSSRIDSPVTLGAREEGDHSS